MSWIQLYLMILGVTPICCEYCSKSRLVLNILKYTISSVWVERCGDNADVLGSNPRSCISPVLGAFIIPARSGIMAENEIMSSVFEEVSKSLDQDIQRQVAESNKKLFAEKLI